MSKRKVWVYRPPRQSKAKVPDGLKQTLKAKADQLVESVIKPRHIKPPPEDERFNYLVDVHTKWRQSCFYFYARYCSPGPNAVSPFFETGFARMQYIGGNLFSLSYMRHTGKWWEIYPELSLEECFTAIAEEPHFLP